MAAGTVWTIGKILEWTRQYFTGKGLENPRLDAELLLCEVLGCQRITLYVHFDQPLEVGELARYRDYVARRGRQEPLAYILGHREFMQFDFKVSPAVLIPRPETELLVEKVVQAVQAAAPKPELTLLDLGTGSGAILLSLLKLLPEAKGTAVDVSPSALEIARTNAVLLGVAARTTFVQSDLWQQVQGEAAYEVVVSNPPYIPSQVIATLALDVQQEPRMALDGGRDGLDFYRRILAGLAKHLRADGLLALEIGMDQGQAVAQLCRQQGWQVVAVAQDLAALDRMVFATKEGSKYADFILGIKGQK